MVRQNVVVIGFFLVLPLVAGCSSDDSVPRAGLKAAGALLTPNNDDKPVDNVTLSTISDPAKLDEAVALTAELHAVKTVRGQGAPVNDSHLEVLGKIPTIIDLNLNETPVTDAGIAHLANSKKLFQLLLYGTEVTDACLEHIGKIKTLQNLNLGNTKVTGDLSALKGLTELDWLVVSDLPELPDGLVDTLIELPKFTHLQITNTKISPEALDRLRKAKPGIVID